MGSIKNSTGIDAFSVNQMENNDTSILFVKTRNIC